MRMFAWSAVAVLLLALAAIAQMPARHAWGFAHQFAGEQLAPLRLQELSGTVWHGRAARGRWQDVPLRSLRWDWRPVSLLKAKLGFDVEAEVGGARVAGQIETRTGEAVTLTDGSVFWTLAELLAVAKPPPQLGALSGDLTAEIETLRLDAGAVETAVGKLVISGLRHAGLKDLVLGDFELDASMDNGRVVATGEDLSGLIDLDLKFELAEDQNWQLSGTLAPTAEAPDQIRGVLPLFGRRQADGRYEIAWFGNFTSGQASRGQPSATP